jgi:hypothetical protein
VQSSDIVAPLSNSEYTLPPGLDPLHQYCPCLQFPINPYNQPLQDWADCLFVSVQSSTTGGPVLHIPYYCPFLCLLTESLPIHHSIGVEHCFEYQHKSTGKPLVVIYLIITPSYHHSDPHWCNSHNPHSQVPSYIFILHSFPYHIPIFLHQELHNLSVDLDYEDLTKFADLLDHWLRFVWKPSSDPSKNLSPPSQPLQPPPFPHPSFASTTPGNK